MVQTMVRKKGSKHGANLPVRTSLAGWWRYRTGITNVNGACSSWFDSSGNMNSLVQATAANRPTILSDGSLSFDGSNDYLAAAFTLAQPLTVYVAFQQVSWTSGDVIVDGVTATVKLGQAGSTPGIAANAGSALSTDTTIPVSPLLFGVACFVANSTSSVYQAGGGSQSVTVTGNAGTNDAGGITLGADRSGANNANIIVKEAIAYSAAHDAATRLQVMRYLGRIASVGGI